MINNRNEDNLNREENEKKGLSQNNNLEKRNSMLDDKINKDKLNSDNMDKEKTNFISNEKINNSNNKEKAKNINNLYFLNPNLNENQPNCADKNADTIINDNLDIQYNIENNIGSTFLCKKRNLINDNIVIHSNKSSKNKDPFQKNSKNNLYQNYNNSNDKNINYTWEDLEIKEEKLTNKKDDLSKNFSNISINHKSIVNNNFDKLKKIKIKKFLKKIDSPLENESSKSSNGNIFLVHNSYQENDSKSDSKDLNFIKYAQNYTTNDNLSLKYKSKDKYKILNKEDQKSYNKDSNDVNLNLNNEQNNSFKEISSFNFKSNIKSLNKDYSENNSNNLREINSFLNYNQNYYYQDKLNESLLSKDKNLMAHINSPINIYSFSNNISQNNNNEVINTKNNFILSNIELYSENNLSILDKAYIISSKDKNNFHFNNNKPQECNNSEILNIFNSQTLLRDRNPDLLGFSENKDLSKINEDNIFIKKQKIFNIEKIKKFPINEFFTYNRKLRVFNSQIFNNKNKKMIFSIIKPLPKLNKFKDIIAYNKDLMKLWDKKNENHIFEDENDLINMENEKNVRNILNYFEGKKNKCSKKELREDSLILRIKTKLLDFIYDSVNSFDDLKNNKLSKPSKEKINKPIIAIFNLEYLRQSIFSIILNGSKAYENGNYKIIETIIKEYNENKAHNDLINHFHLSVQDCLDIFRNKKEIQIKYKYRLVDYLFEQNQKLKNGKIKLPNSCSIKEYIASLILLSNNFELYFYKRKNNAIKKKNQGKLIIYKYDINF